VYIQTRCGGSGRGGGYHTTTYSAWVATTWDFAGNATSWAKLASAPAVDPALSVPDGYGETVYNTGTAAFLVVPVPAAPSGVIAVQSGDELQVSWTPEGVSPNAITSSILTATPDSSTASILTATVPDSATSGSILALEPQTTYQVTVVNTSASGSGPASTPIAVTTSAASIAPSAPTGLIAHWQAAGAATATLVAKWKAAVPGDSPIDQYEVQITGSDGAGTFSKTVPGTHVKAKFTVDWIPDWTVMARAHNATGWGPWSATFRLGGL